MSLKDDLEIALRNAVPVTDAQARVIATNILPGKELKQFLEWLDVNGAPFLERINHG